MTLSQEDRTDIQGDEPAPDAKRPPPARSSRADRRVATLSHLVLTLWALAVVLPLVWTFFSSLKDSRSINVSPFALPEVLHWDNYVRAWNTIGVAKYFANTVIIVGCAATPSRSSWPSCRCSSSSRTATSSGPTRA